MDDPDGKNCPIAWKWVNNVNESDIIVFTALDNVELIKKIESYKYDKKNQKLLLVSMESFLKRPYLLTKKKYFDYIIDYHLDSDVPIPYTSLLTSDKLVKRNEYYNFTKEALPTREKAKNDRGIAVMFISNCRDKNKRLNVLKELMKYIKIDSYGKCLHNKDTNNEDMGNNNHETKMNIIRKYKFTLAFENSNDRDYVTEKFFQSLDVGSVPIYYGAYNIADFAPEHSYIDVNDFENVKELAEYLNYLDNNDEEYEKYLAWKKKALYGDFGDNLNRLVNIGKLNYICQLLKRINNIWINPYLTIWDRKDVPKNERVCKLC